MADPRRTPARPDLAADHLRGTVDAARFVAGTEMVVTAPIAPLRRAPRPDAPLDSEALRGERFTVYEHDHEGWSWGQIATDQYVGFLPADALANAGAAPTHRIRALRTFAFPGPSIKLPPAATLPMGARITITRAQNDFLVSDDGLFLPAHHLAPIGVHEKDFVAVALGFVGTPYLWGGRTSLGIDCSGLVQTALCACGIKAPRDSDMQETETGTLIGTTLDTVSLRRGDLLFWKGHVAIACDAATIVHANAFHMAVACEDARQALARIASSGSPLTAIKRLEPAPL